MSTQQIEKIKEKLRKLIRKQESAEKIGNLQEAEAFANKVQELIMEYQIEIDDLKEKDEQTGIIFDKRVDTSDLTVRNEGDWIRRLFSSCSVGTSNRVLFHGRDKQLVYIIGDDISIEVLEYMVSQLSVKLRGIARSSFAEYKKGPGMDKRNTYIRSFLQGACVGIRSQLEENIKQYNSHPQAHGLILARDVKLQNYIADKWGRLGQSRSRNSSSSAGAANGYAAGKSMNINKGVGAAGPSGARLLN